MKSASDTNFLRQVDAGNPDRNPRAIGSTMPVL
jgi:hypothetical protein